MLGENYKEPGEAYDDKKLFLLLGGYIINSYTEPAAACISSLHILLTSLWPAVKEEQYLCDSEEMLLHSEPEHVHKTSEARNHTLASVMSLI